VVAVKSLRVGVGVLIFWREWVSVANRFGGGAVMPPGGSRSTLLRLRPEERVNGLLRVGNDQPFFLRATFLLLSFRCGLSRHTVVSSHWFSNGGVPQPGIEPGRPKWAPACKAGLTAISSTGGFGGGGGIPTRDKPISNRLLYALRYVPFCITFSFPFWFDQVH
jgi:hypothetical protein